MNVKEVVAAHLKRYGYDGLFCPGECACQIDDLAPCDSSSFITCEPGYKVPCKNSAQCECGHDEPRAGECWRIQREKPTEGVADVSE